MTTMTCRVFQVCRVSWIKEDVQEVKQSLWQSWSVPPPSPQIKRELAVRWSNRKLLAAAPLRCVHLRVTHMEAMGYSKLIVEHGYYNCPILHSSSGQSLLWGSSSSWDFLRAALQYEIPTQASTHTLPSQKCQAHITENSPCLLLLISSSPIYF